MKYTNILLVLTLLLSLQLVANDSPLSDVFEQKYQQLMVVAETAPNSETISRQAQGVWLETRKILLVLDANIESRKLEATVYKGEEQRAIMDELIDLSAERERLLMSGIQKMSLILEDDGSDVPVLSKQRDRSNDLMVNQQTAPQNTSGITIELTPENLTKTGWD